MTEPVRYRQGNGDDRDAILALRAAAFGPIDPEKGTPAFWEWEFARGYAGVSPLFVAESGTQLVGHLGFLPQELMTPAGPLRAAMAVDAMVHPQFHHRGIFSGLTRFAAAGLRDAFALALGLQIRKASLAAMLAAGWHIADRIPVRLKPLSWMRAAGDLLHPDRPAQGGGVIPPSHPRVRPLTPADFSQLAAMRSGPLHQPRTAAFAQWRFLDPPERSYTLDGWFEGEVLRAYVVHCRTLLKGMRTQAILDAGAQPGGETALRELIRDVCRRGGNASLAASLLTDAHPATPVMRRCGFLAGPHRFNLLLQVFDSRFRAAATAPWSLSWADTDHL